MRLSVWTFTLTFVVGWLAGCVFIFVLLTSNDASLSQQSMVRSRPAYASLEFRERPEQRFSLSAVDRERATGNESSRRMPSFAQISQLLSSYRFPFASPPEHTHSHTAKGENDDGDDDSDESDSRGEFIHEIAKHRNPHRETESDTQAHTQAHTERERRLHVFLDWPQHEKRFSAHNAHALQTMLAALPGARFRCLLPLSAHSSVDDSNNDKGDESVSVLHRRRGALSLSLYRKLGFDVDAVRVLDRDARVFRLFTLGQAYRQRWFARYADPGTARDRESETLGGNVQEEGEGGAERETERERRSAPPYHLLTYIRLVHLWRKGGIFADFSFFFRDNPFKDSHVQQAYYINSYCVSETQTGRLSLYRPQSFDSWRSLRCFTSSLYLFRTAQSPLLGCVLRKYDDEIFSVCVESDAFYGGAECVRKAFQQCANALADTDTHTHTQAHTASSTQHTPVSLAGVKHKAKRHDSDASRVEDRDTHSHAHTSHIPDERSFGVSPSLLQRFDDDPLRAARALSAVREMHTQSLTQTHNLSHALTQPLNSSVNASLSSLLSVWASSDAHNASTPINKMVSPKDSDTQASTHVGQETLIDINTTLSHNPSVLWLGHLAWQSESESEADAQAVREIETETDRERTTVADEVVRAAQSEVFRRMPFLGDRMYLVMAEEVRHRETERLALAHILSHTQMPTQSHHLRGVAERVTESRTQAPTNLTTHAVLSRLPVSDTREAVVVRERERERVCSPFKHTLSLDMNTLSHTLTHTFSSQARTLTHTHVNVTLPHDTVNRVRRRCAPSLFLAGFAHSGTAVVRSLLQAHPFVLSGWTREKGSHSHAHDSNHDKERNAFTNTHTDTQQTDMHTLHPETTPPPSFSNSPQTTQHTAEEVVWSRAEVPQGCYSTLAGTHALTQRWSCFPFVESTPVCVSVERAQLRGNESSDTLCESERGRLSESEHVWRRFSPAEVFHTMDVAHYDLDPLSASAIHQDNPNAKIVFVMCDPLHRILRALSHTQGALREELERLSFASLDDALLSLVESPQSPLSLLRHSLTTLPSLSASGPRTAPDSVSRVHTEDGENAVEIFLVQFFSQHSHTRFFDRLIAHSLYLPSLLHFSRRVGREQLVLLRWEDTVNADALSLLDESVRETKNSTVRERTMADNTEHSFPDTPRVRVPLSFREVFNMTTLRALHDALALPFSEPATNRRFMRSLLRDVRRAHSLFTTHSSQTLSQMDSHDEAEGEHSEKSEERLTLSRDVYRKLQTFFSPFVDKLEEFSSQNLTHWKGSSPPTALPGYSPGWNISRPLLWFEPGFAETKTDESLISNNIIPHLLPQRTTEEDVGFNTTLGMLNIL